MATTLSSSASRAFLVDASGVLADGTPFPNLVEFRQALLTHKTEFERNFAEKPKTYAIERTVVTQTCPRFARL